MFSNRWKEAEGRDSKIVLFFSRAFGLDFGRRENYSIV
jgi:hypothetical protein